MWTAEHYLRIALRMVGEEGPHNEIHVREIARDFTLPRPTTLQCKCIIELAEKALASE